MTGQVSDSSPIIAGCGAIAVDEILVLDRPLSSGKGRVVRRELAHGGNVATALAAVGALGGHGRWLGYLSAGEGWAHVRDDLRSHGVDISMSEASAQPPIRSTILVQPNGERFIAFDDQTLIGAAADLDVSKLDGADVLLVDSYAVANGFGLIDHAIASGIPVVVDLERVDSANTARLLTSAQHLVVPLEAARELREHASSAPEVIVERLWSSDRHAVVLTDGVNGAWFRSSSDTGHVPAFAVDAVDTSGCGDVFHGAYALAIGRSAPIREAVTFASAAAAICATAIGGRGHLPTTSEVLNFLR